MFQSKVFRRMFFSYILIILVSTVLFTVSVIYQSRKIADSQRDWEHDLIIREVSNIMDEILSDARDTARDLKYSTTMKNLYMASRLDDPLDSYEDYEVQKEIKNLWALRGDSIYSTTIFLYGSNRAWSAGGPIYMDKPFEEQDFSVPALTNGSIAETINIEDNQRYYFAKDGLLYWDSYTYRTGTEVGLCCVLIDLTKTLGSIEAALDDEQAIRISYEGKELLTVGDVGSRSPAVVLEGNNDFTYELFDGSYSFIKGNNILIGMLTTFLILTLIFVWIAYWESKRYYKPIDYLGKMVGSENSIREDQDGNEMNSIINGIQDLIGEKNSYREKMLTITPYAGAAMIQAIMSGRDNDEKLGVLSEEDFLDLKHPYYIVSILNFAYEWSRNAKEISYKDLEKLFEQVSATWTTEDMHIAWYFSNKNTVYLILSLDEKRDIDDIFYGIHKLVQSSVEKEHIIVTMGVDVVREDISELKLACEGASSALDGILHDGRGEVFFVEEFPRQNVDYYLPTGFKEKLRTCLEKRDKYGIHDLLFDIYKTNLELDASADVYKSLAEDFYLTMMKTIRKVSGLTTVHLNIQRVSELMSLQEIFDYYDAALISIIDLLEKNEREKKEETKLDDEIIKYVEEQYCDPNISLQQLSDKFNVSNKYLLLLFKQRYNVTYLQFVQGRRIEKAVELIEQNAMPISEIGAKVGYENQLTFRRNFKAQTGLNPSEYAARKK
ncbi:MAG: helix-turn-helix transcriptional regulator [Butyrivibrio sp.]|nr:helix-turn-helix transcriptional regulator [Butyrivibrio sp.]